jgi:hypothetical protein
MSSSKYIIFGKNALKKENILCVRARKSSFWFLHPYIIDLMYAKTWSESFMVGFPFVKFPITRTFHFIEFKLKYRNLSEIKKEIESFKENNIDVEDNIK